MGIGAAARNRDTDRQVVLRWLRRGIDEVTLREYQERALTTDQMKTDQSDPPRLPIVALLGLAGEVGSVLTEYKKQLRDQPSYTVFDRRIEEELGDVLWYVSNIASKANLDLDDIATKNLEKAQGRWVPADNQSLGADLFDLDFPPSEQIPRRFHAELYQNPPSHIGIVKMEIDGREVGNPLRDDAYEDDGYRFHDIFHISYATVLGWSPVTRKLLNCKRRSRPDVDDVEDGGRAKVIEEGIASLVFDYAADHNFLDGIRTIDYELLRILKRMTRRLEVRRRSEHDWQSAILQGYDAWRVARANGLVRLDCDLYRKEMKVIPD